MADLGDSRVWGDLNVGGNLKVKGSEVKPSAMELITSAVFNGGSSSFSATNLTDEYHTYKIILRNIRVQTSQNLQIYLSSDNLSTYVSDSIFVSMSFTPESLSWQASENTSGINFSIFTHINSSAKGCSGEITIVKPSDSNSPTMCYGDIHCHNNDNTLKRSFTSTSTRTNNIVNSFQLVGRFTAGEIYLYGIK